jgi:hypothetical protein
MCRPVHKYNLTEIQLWSFLVGVSRILRDFCEPWAKLGRAKLAGARRSFSFLLENKWSSFFLSFAFPEFAACSLRSSEFVRKLSRNLGNLIRVKRNFNPRGLISAYKDRQMLCTRCCTRSYRVPGGCRYLYSVGWRGFRYVNVWTRYNLKHYLFALLN